MVNGVVKNTPCCLYHSSLKSICEKLAAWMTEAMSTAQYAYVRLVQQSRQCQGQPAAIEALYRKPSSPYLLQNHASKLHMMLTISPKGQSLHRSLQLVRPNTHCEVWLLMRSVRIYFVRVYRDDVVLFRTIASPGRASPVFRVG